MLEDRPAYDRPGLDDPMWNYALTTRLQPYIDAIRKWWNEIESLEVKDTGVYEIQDGPPGLFYRFTRTAIRSPIRNIQAFPFVQVAFLQLSGVQGGANKMVDRECAKGLTIEEFTVICKSNLPSTFQSGQFLAVVPTDILVEAKNIGRWLYITDRELLSIGRGIVEHSLKQKALLKL